MRFTSPTRLCVRRDEALEPLRRVGWGIVRLHAGDLAHEPAEHAARAELEELVAAGVGERCDAVDPAHRAGDLGDSASRTPSASVTSWPTRSRPAARAGSLHATSAIRSAIFACAGFISALWKAAPTCSWTTRAAPGLRRELHQPVDAGDLAGDDDLGRGVEVRGRDEPGRPSLTAELRERVRLEPDDRRPSCPAARSGPRPSAGRAGHEAHAVVHAQRAGRHRGGVLAEAVAGDEVGLEARVAGHSATASERAKSAGCATSVRVSDSSGPRARTAHGQAGASSARCK